MREALKNLILQSLQLALIRRTRSESWHRLKMMKKTLKTLKPKTVKVAIALTLTSIKRNLMALEPEVMKNSTWKSI